MKQLLLFFGILFSSTIFGQTNNGVLKSKLYVDSINYLSKDTFEIVIYNTLNEQIVSKSLECGKINISLPPGIYGIKCKSKTGEFITIENVKINYKSLSFYDINVSSISEQ